MKTKTILLATLLLCCGILSLNAQAPKKVQKPIKLQAKTDLHKISYDRGTDVFYFTNTDLINLFQKIEDADAAGAVNFLQNYHKEIEFKKGETKYKNAGERSLFNMIDRHLKEIVLAGKAADMAKGATAPNLFILVSKCASDSTLQTLTEKKGRVVLECH